MDTEESIYGLEVKDRVHLLRLLTDYLLNLPENPVRNKVEEMYNVRSQ